MRRTGVMLLLACCGISSSCRRPSPPAHGPPPLREAVAPIEPPKPPRPAIEATECPRYGAPRLLARLRVPGLDEASGLVASRTQRGVLFVHNDSGDAPVVHAVSLSGAHLGSWRLTPASHVDWEDIAIGPCTPGSARACLYIADIGDNRARRAGGVTVYVAPEPEVPDVPRRAVLPVLRQIHYRYPDGPRDAESLVVHPRTGDLYIIEKRPRRDGKRGRGVYRIEAGSRRDRRSPVVAQRLGFIDPPRGSDGLFTAADVHPGGRRLILRTYQTIVELRLQPGPPFETIFFKAARVRLKPPGQGFGLRERQGESVAYSADGRSVYTTSEGDLPPLNTWSCLPAR